MFYTSNHVTILDLPLILWYYFNTKVYVFFAAVSTCSPIGADVGRCWNRLCCSTGDNNSSSNNNNNITTTTTTTNNNNKIVIVITAMIMILILVNYNDNNNNENDNKSKNKTGFKTMIIINSCSLLEQKIRCYKQVISKKHFQGLFKKPFGEI